MLLAVIGFAAVAFISGSLAGYVAKGVRDTYCHHRGCGSRLRCPAHEAESIRVVQARGGRLGAVR